MINQAKNVRIFLSYARQDKEKVEHLYQRLKDAGLNPWMDTKDLIPGQQWHPTIMKSIKETPFFLACLSTNSIKKRGVIQEEIKEALTTWKQKLDDDIYLIPVRLEECEVPDALIKFQWVNLFEKEGFEKLIKAINSGIEKLGRVSEIHNPDKPKPNKNGHRALLKVFAINCTKKPERA